MTLALRPVSAGLLLSYQCSSECRHCMYACSSKWSADWVSIEVLTKTLAKLRTTIIGFPGKIGINYGIHFTGGEPFLNFDLLLQATELARDIGIHSTFVETNSFWCVDDPSTERKLRQLRAAGLEGILISVNPFIVDQVPFERTETAVRMSREVFGDNAIVYQDVFYQQLKALGVKGTLPFEDYVYRAPYGLQQAELLPMGRAAYQLGHLYRGFPADDFFDQSCRKELLRDWHVHIDNYGNYIPGYCAGLSLGNWLEVDQANLKELSIVRALVNTGVKELCEIARDFGYECQEGYVSKCHLCVDMRRYLVQRTTQFKELRPREFYSHLR